ncbi:MAG: GNAT family N-acetyltransferase [Candidatus Eisenbacteria bacterium]
MSPDEGRVSTAPALVIREAGDADLPATLKCMDEVFHESGGERVQEFDRDYWMWQYRGGSQPAVVLIAEDPGGVCGYYHAVLHDLNVDGRPVRAAMVQDVGTRASHRGRGVFRAMGGRALESLRERGVDFIYTFPNRKSLPSFVRNHGYTIVERVPVMLLPLDLGRGLAERGHLGALGRVAGGAMAGIWRGVRGGSTRPRPGESIEAPATVSPGLATCVLAGGGPGIIALARSPGYLTWRFVESPHRRYRLHTLVRDGIAQAYLFSRDAEILGTPVTLIMDLGHRPGEEDALGRLVRIRAVEERGAGRVASVSMCLGPERRILAHAGYLRIPERLNPRPFNLLVKDLSNTRRDHLLDATRWRITLADWDVY